MIESKEVIVKVDKDYSFTTTSASFLLRKMPNGKYQKFIEIAEDFNNLKFSALRKLMVVLHEYVHLEYYLKGLVEDDAFEREQRQ